MTKDEAPASPKDAALRLALEALKYSVSPGKKNPAIIAIIAITAIEQVFGQQEPEDYPTYDGYIKKALEQLNPPCKTGSQCTSKCDGCAESEPVPIGYMNAGHVHEMQQGRLPHGYVYPKGSVGADVAVYTSPPKREWAWLTKEDVDQAWGDGEVRGLSRYDIARAIEAKLKAKNGFPQTEKNT